MEDRKSVICVDIPLSVPYLSPTRLKELSDPEPLLELKANVATCKRCGILNPESTPAGNRSTRVLPDRREVAIRSMLNPKFR
jgi:hypothetical protein